MEAIFAYSTETFDCWSSNLQTTKSSYFEYDERQFSQFKYFVLNELKSHLNWIGDPFLNLSYSYIIFLTLSKCLEIAFLVVIGRFKQSQIQLSLFSHSKPHSYWLALHLNSIDDENTESKSSFYWNLALFLIAPHYLYQLSQTDCKSLLISLLVWA